MSDLCQRCGRAPRGVTHVGEPRAALSMPLDPKVLEERLWRIDLVIRSDFNSDQEAFAHLKKMIFDLRMDIARAASGA